MSDGARMSAAIAAQHSDTVAEHTAEGAAEAHPCREGHTVPRSSDGAASRHARPVCRHRAGAGPCPWPLARRPGGGARQESTAGQEETGWGKLTVKPRIASDERRHCELLKTKMKWPCSGLACRRRFRRETSDALAKRSCIQQSRVACSSSAPWLVQSGAPLHGCNHHNCSNRRIIVVSAVGAEQSANFALRKLDDGTYPARAGQVWQSVSLLSGGVPVSETTAFPQLL